MTERQAKLIIEQEKSWESDDRKIDAFIMGISALEKQIPKKPKYEGMVAGIFQKSYTCPTCSNCCLTMKMNQRQNTSFCWDCGQKLDWNDEI